MSGLRTIMAQARRVLVAAPIVIILVLLSQTASLADPSRTAVAYSDASPVAATIRAAHFPEPLIATAATTPDEDLALARAVTAYGQRTRPDDVSSLTAFLSGYPTSGWAPALLTNLGLSYLHYGYFSRAIDAWRRAWSQGREATEPQARALVDRAVGELARLYASFGHVESLAALLDDMGNRPVSGSATEAVQVAAEQLLLVRKDPRHLFICGPSALRSLILAQDAGREQEVDFLRWYRAGPDGTNLAEVARLADKAKFPHRVVFRQPGHKVPMPAIVHWKVGHFATIVGEANGRFHVIDPVFPGRSLWVTQAALDAEASGYFLVRTDAQATPGWRPVDDGEAGSVWGKGPTNGTTPGDAGDPPAKGRGGNRPDVLRGSGQQGDQDSGNDPGEDDDDDDDDDCPMCHYDIKESSVSVTLSDVPVGYKPPIGPSAKVRITYNQREANQPQNFNFFNISPKWTLNWLGYITDDPNNLGANVSRSMGGGGAFFYTGYTSSTGQFAAQFDDGSVLVLASQTPITYQRHKRDGGIEIYAQSDGSTGYPRNVFLSKVIDPQGNAVTLNYDGQRRLTSLTDATGRQTTFTYGLPARPLLVTQITDPFGRSATLAYDANGRLSSITDVIGLMSSFAYDANSLVNALTTPYGTTTFAYTAPGTSAPPRFVQVTDPMGFNEREEWLEPAPMIPDSEPAGAVPQGMPVPLTNQYLTYRNSFHWDKHAYVVAGCTPTGGCDYSRARVSHFSHLGSGSIKSTSLESIRYPLEGRIWFAYPGQTNAFNSGSFNQPIAIGRVLDDGTTQLSQFSYDTAGSFKVTSATDPVGRKTSFVYANGIDLSAVSQTTEYGMQTTIAQFTYNVQHRPLVYTNAAGQTTTYTYNAAGQLTSVTDPLNQTTSFQYDSAGRLITITNANNVVAATFTYDAYDRVATFTDSEGWSVSYSYDASNRLTKTTYLDGTTETYTYDRLDRASYKDRVGRVWAYTYDANRRLTKVRDPVGLETQFGYNEAGNLTRLTDPKGNITRWTYDMQRRLTSRRYADGSTVTYTYEATTSRLKSVTDALGQTKQFSYANDDRLTGVVYLNAAYPTPNIGVSYDLYFPRPKSITDGNGTTHYSYVPVGSPGALGLQQETSPFPNSTITYAYDLLGAGGVEDGRGIGSRDFPVRRDRAVDQQHERSRRVHAELSGPDRTGHPASTRQRHLIDHLVLSRQYRRPPDGWDQQYRTVAKPILELPVRDHGREPHYGVLGDERQPGRLPKPGTADRDLQQCEPADFPFGSAVAL